MQKFRTGVVATIATLSLIGVAAPAAGAPAQAVAAPTVVPWSASHGAATASGGRWLETRPGQVIPDVVVEGQLATTGAGCHAVWVQWRRDFFPLPWTQVASRCGAGTTPVATRFYGYLPTVTGQLKVCRGQADQQDCGPSTSLTSWPVAQQ
ncbi:hypothetical protein [Micromonospora sp. NPDC049175]|uniref:hypothetical protein n=1 Tax=unclassified Micromonospora TaxID=2617518 RepID=UPI00371565D7